MAPDTPDEPAPALAAARHFAQHRSFYRAMLTGPCAYALSMALSGLLTPFNQQLVERMSGARPAPDLLEDLTTFVTGGWAAVINRWLIDGADPLDPEAFTDRLMGMLGVITGASPEPDSTTQDKEHGR